MKRFFWKNDGPLFPNGIKEGLPTIRSESEADHALVNA